MDLHTKRIGDFSLLILLVTQVITANIIQNGPSDQKVDFITATNTNTNNNTAIKINNTSVVTNEAQEAANVIAEQYELLMKQVAQQRSKNKGQKSSSSHYHNLETRQNLFDFVDIDVLHTNKDKNANSPQSKRVTSNKATDYYVLSPQNPSSTRSAKNGKHFGESADADTDDTTGNAKHKLDFPLAMMTSLGSNQPNIIINQHLHPKQRPASNFLVNSENIMFTFKVGSDDDDDEDNSAGVVKSRKRLDRYFISIVVEKMKCTMIPNDDENSPKLVIRGGEHELSFCRTIDNSVNNFQSVDYVTSGDKFVTVQGTGDWVKENSTAFLTASIYLETSNCNNCPDDHFCCGSKHTACSNKFSVPHEYHERFRCVPKEDANGRSLLCDGHPNCGFHCNWDEGDSTCPPSKDPPGHDDGSGESCQGYDCRDLHEDRFLITLILLIVFCVFVPFCIFLFFCTRKDMGRSDCGRGRGNGRCPLPLEIIFCPFSISADEGDGDSRGSTSTSTGQRSRQRQAMRQNQGRSRGNVRRAVRRVAEVNPGGMTTPAAGLQNLGFLDDLPPPYSECCNDKIMFPSPPSKEPSPPPPLPPISTHASIGEQRERPSTSTSSDFQLDTISAGIIPRSHSMPLTVASFPVMPTINHVNETSN